MACSTLALPAGKQDSVWRVACPLAFSRDEVKFHSLRKVLVEHFPGLPWLLSLSRILSPLSRAPEGRALEFCSYISVGQTSSLKEITVFWGWGWGARGGGRKGVCSKYFMAALRFKDASCSACLRKIPCVCSLLL